MATEPDINTCYTGDFLQVCKSWPDKCVDMVLTSPPFVEKDMQEYWVTYENCFKEMNRLARKAVVIIHSATKLNYLMANYPPKRLMIWGKGISQCSYRFNPILVYQMSDSYKVNSYIWADTFGVPPIAGSKKIHKYQDPLTLYVEILKMFKGCDSVLDPFAGSGTTLEACATIGKNYVGVEFCEEYVKNLIVPRMAAISEEK